MISLKDERRMKMAANIVVMIMTVFMMVCAGIRVM